MKERLEIRLRDLEREFAHGQQRLTEIQQEQQAVSATMLRVAGAIQVLQQLLAEESCQPGMEQHGTVFHGMEQQQAEAEVAAQGNHSAP